MSWVGYIEKGIVNANEQKYKALTGLIGSQKLRYARASKQGFK
jgi:hypothetical protein